jgi:DHA1 family inner membrane transport protein
VAALLPLAGLAIAALAMALDRTPAAIASANA